MSQDIKQILKKILLIIIILGIIFLLDKTNILNEQTNSIKEKTTVEKKIKEDFQIHYIDVGQADSTLIKIYDEYVLIDAGNNEDGKKLVDYFKSLGISKFKYVITTHSHEDHIGGMDDIIRNFSIEHFYIPKTKVEYMTYTEVIRLLKEEKINYETPAIDDKFSIKDANFKILSIKDDPDDINDTSIVLKLNFKNTSYIFLGDASYKVEKKILEKDIESDVLKVGHHGSSYSTSAHFLKRVNPKYAIISVGKNNDYKLPKKVTLDKLNKLKIKTYRTDKQGTIILSSDGENIYFEFKKTDTNNEKE